VVAVKSMQHFRADFEPIADQVIVCDSGALATLDYAQLPFVKRPRPLFPFETDIDISAWLAQHAQGLTLAAPR
jgi:microcystin degradation protein MlrC